jgi:hypothetical protein
MKIFNRNNLHMFQGIAVMQLWNNLPLNKKILLF